MASLIANAIASLYVRLVALLRSLDQNRDVAPSGDGAHHDTGFEHIC